jgi:hypothetical protein
MAGKPLTRYRAPVKIGRAQLLPLAVRGYRGSTLIFYDGVAGGIGRCGLLPPPRSAQDAFVGDLVEVISAATGARVAQVERAPTMQYHLQLALFSQRLMPLVTEFALSAALTAAGVPAFLRLGIDASRYASCLARQQCTSQVRAANPLLARNAAQLVSAGSASLDWRNGLYDVDPEPLLQEPSPLIPRTWTAPLDFFHLRADVAHSVRRILERAGYLSDGGIELTPSEGPPVVLASRTPEKVGRMALTMLGKELLATGLLGLKP